jgi:NAD(P)-dependent dehydrogenase (short-subunit alcohol dehydrogenase family)
MRVRLKPLDEQVVVITGATSGIGLVTARHAARRGARLVLAARNESALRELATELTAQGHDAAYVVVDVADEADVRRIADAAIARFGGFDTWVNNAGVLIYGRVEDVDTADARRLFETNFWGIWHGSRVALEHLRHRGGALINLGSDVSEHAAPLMGPYVASKHAVMGLTDALRVEVREQRLPVAVTLIRPSAIDTPIVARARNVMDVAPRLPPPVYAPEVVARAILHAAEHQTRDLFAGGAARALSTMTHLGPATADWVMRVFMFEQMHAQRPANNASEGLHASPDMGLRERGGSQRWVLEHSLYTRMAMHPVASRIVGYGLLAVLAAMLFARYRVRATAHGGAGSV